MKLIYVALVAFIFGLLTGGWIVRRAEADAQHEAEWHELMMNPFIPGPNGEIDSINLETGKRGSE